MNGSEAKATYGAQKHSFISEKSAVSRGLKIHSLPAKEVQYFERSSHGKHKGEKAIKSTGRVKTTIKYCGKQIPEVKFYVVPKREHLDGDVVIGTKLVELYDQMASAPPAITPLPHRGSVPRYNACAGQYYFIYWGTVSTGYPTIELLPLFSTSPRAWQRETSGADTRLRE